MLRSSSTKKPERRRILVLGTVYAIFSLALLAAPNVADAAGQFTFLQSGFNQDLYATAPGFFGGVAFAPNGDPWVAQCDQASPNPLHRFDSSTTTPINGSNLHPEVSGSPFASNAGCGLTNHPNGTLYTNAGPGRIEMGSRPVSGVIQLSATTGAQIGGPFGPDGNTLGIATDPQTGNLVYVGSNGTINFVDAALTTSGTFSTATTGDFVDGIAFDPTGNFLFLSNRSPSFRLTILDRSGALVQHAPMSSEPDGISFHAVTPKFVVTSNANGTMTRFDFPGDDFTKPPVQSVFARGGFRGDLAQVGPDSCMYLTQYRTRYDNGTVSGQDSLVRICAGFATLTPAPENATAGCSVLSRSVRMSRRGAVGVRLACLVAAKGTLRLECAGSHKRAKKKHRTLTLGRKAFSLKAGRSTLTLRLTRTGRRLVVRRKRVRARATITLEGVANASTTSGVLTIKARAKRNRPRGVPPFQATRQRLTS